MQLRIDTIWHRGEGRPVMAEVTVWFPVLSQKLSLFQRFFITVIGPGIVVLPGSAACSAPHSRLQHTRRVHLSLYVTTIDVHVPVHRSVCKDTKQTSKPLELEGAWLCY